MFTGLIEEVGRVASIARSSSGTGASGKGLRLTIEAHILSPAMPLGASLAVDGVCLTIVSSVDGRAEVEVGPETLERSSLGAFVVGRRVNLERALRVGDRLGGHIVQGHVDGTGCVVAAVARGEAWDVRVALPEGLCRYVIEKGSICVDGISLTVNRLEPDGFWVSLIPHSQGLTTLASRVPGDRLNIEVDLVGKYVERLLGARAAPSSGLTLSQLKENGFV